MRPGIKTVHTSKYFYTLTVGVASIRLSDLHMYKPLSVIGAKVEPSSVTKLYEVGYEVGYHGSQ